jgi:excisionase family DNA binding protein
MQNTFNIDGLMDALVERIAEKVALQLSESGTGKTLRPRLLSVEDAGVYLGRTKEAVQHMIANGTLPVVRDGRRVFLDIEALDRWIKANSIPMRSTMEAG